MIGRRSAIHLAFAALAAAAMLPAARAQQSFQRFVPFLVELPGWKANKPDGMAMEMAGSNMITATRAYEKGAAHVNASLLTGMAAQGVEMRNLIGDDINNWQKYAANPKAKLHLYGKKEAREGRKMGHVTFLELPVASC